MYISSSYNNESFCAVTSIIENMEDKLVKELRVWGNAGHAERRRGSSFSLFTQFYENELRYSACITIRLSS